MTTAVSPTLVDNFERALARTNIEFANAIEDALRFRRKALYWRSIGFEDGAKANFWLARSSLRMARSWRVP